MPRPPKSTIAHRRDGTFRAHRHAGRGDVNFDGVPEKPRGLDRHGQWMWDFITTSSPPGMLARIDTPALLALCRWWTQWVQGMEQLENDASWKATCRASMAWKHVERLLSKFGVTPSERCKLQVPLAVDEEEDDLLKVLRGDLN